MADNLLTQAASPATVPAGTIIATDDISGVAFQRVKATWGADGTAVDVSAASPLPVVQTGTPALPTGAATETTLATLNAKTPGAYSKFRTANLLATPQQIKSAAGALYSFVAVNNVATIRWLKFYDKATSPTVGTDTPILTIGVPASGFTALNLPGGLTFTNGLWVAAVTGSADSSTVAPSAFDIIFQGFYI